MFDVLLNVASERFLRHSNYAQLHKKTVTGIMLKSQLTRAAQNVIE